MIRAIATYTVITVGTMVVVTAVPHPLAVAVVVAKPAMPARRVAALPNTVTVVITRITVIAGWITARRRRHTKNR